MRKLWINVTDGHIARGLPQFASCCPVALAVEDICGYGDTNVAKEFIDFTYDGTFYENVDLPGAAIEFIRCFDFDRNSVAPFAFEIELPESDV